MGVPEQEIREEGGGEFFRDVVIDPNLREFVDTILTAESPDLAAVTFAKHRIRRSSRKEASYLHASEVRSYLEERIVKFGTESRVYPVVGDLFLEAMETNLDTMGPHFFEDHYKSMLDAYRQGDQPTKSVEGPLYVVDLMLYKAVTLFLAHGDLGPDRPDEDQGAQSFLDTDAPQDYRELISLYLSTGETAIGDAVDSLTAIPREDLPRNLTSYVADSRAALLKMIQDWRRFHTGLEAQQLSEEAYLARALDIAEDTKYLPLVMHLKERLARLHQEHPAECAEPWDAEAIRHAYYEAGDLLHVQGNREREAGAFNLAVRRYTKAKRMFESIHDRTAAAQALVERARALVQEGREPAYAQHDLHKAVQLVIANKMRLKHGELPKVDDSYVVEFLEKKGYAFEAKFYASAPDKTWHGARIAG